MAEMLNNKRVFFPKGGQKNFLDKIIAKESIEYFAKIGGVSSRTIRDWRRESFSMDYGILKKLCRKTETAIPSDIKIKNRYWYVLNGSSAGGKAVFKKFGRIGGDSDYRKKRWRQWWEKEGKHNKKSITTPKPFKRPLLSEELAEFVGILLDDGGISKYQITVTLNCETDDEYGNFIKRLIKRLFGLSASRYYYKKDRAFRIYVSRIGLVRYFTDVVGLKLGNKTKKQADVPDWIINNKQYRNACLRGLIDTDGSVFFHHYKVGNKTYRYKKISFGNRSKPLLDFVHHSLDGIGIKSRIANEKQVFIDGKRDVCLYFKIVGSHNPKHLKRYFE